MNKKAFFAAFLPLILLFSSCSQIKAPELSERLIAEAVGVDLINGEYVISVQALDTGAGGSGEGVDANEKTKIYTFHGITPGSAKGTDDGLIPLYSHARLLILGREAAEKNTARLLDFFLREYNVKSDILIVAAQEKASDVINADTGSAATDAAVTERNLRAGSENGVNVLMPLYRFVNLMLTPGDAAYCPVVAVTDSPVSDKKNIVITGTALFDNEKLLFETDEELTRGILLLTSEAGDMIFTPKGEKGIYTLKTVKSKTKIKPSEKNGRMVFGIKTELICDITEYAQGALDGLTLSDIEETEKAVEKEIAQTENRTLETLFLKNGCDICRFGRRTLLRCPGFYEKYKLSPITLTEYETEVKVTIRRTGRENLKKN